MLYTRVLGGLGQVLVLPRPHMSMLKWWLEHTVQLWLTRTCVWTSKVGTSPRWGEQTMDTLTRHSRAFCHSLWCLLDPVRRVVHAGCTKCRRIAHFLGEAQTDITGEASIMLFTTVCNLKFINYFWKFPCKITGFDISMGRFLSQLSLEPRLSLNLWSSWLASYLLRLQAWANIPSCSMNLDGILYSGTCFVYF